MKTSPPGRGRAITEMIMMGRGGDERRRRKNGNKERIDRQIQKESWAGTEGGERRGVGLHKQSEVSQGCHSG